MKLQTIIRTERGSSIIELMIASVMALLVISAALSFYLSQHKSWLTQSEVTDIQNNARICLDEISGTLRMGGYGLSGQPAFAIGTDSLTVYFVQDSVVDTVRYFVKSTFDAPEPIMYRQIGSAEPEVYSYGIESLTVTQIATSLFEIVLTARAENSDRHLMPNDGYRRRTLRTEVRVRNLAI